MRPGIDCMIFGVGGMTLENKGMDFGNISISFGRRCIVLIMVYMVLRLEAFGLGPQRMAV